MDLEQELREREAEFWTGDADLYRRRLTDDALMVFAPAGVLSRDEIIEAIGAAPRWSAVEVSDFRLVRLDEQVALVTYEARARREGDEAQYVALASSVYVDEAGEWRIAFHQQSPR